MNTWYYSLSSVSFQGNNVKDYNNFSNNLKVQIFPKQPVDSDKNFFTIGSSKDEVLAIQGTPTRIFMNTWYYGLSSISFQGNNVKEYNNFSNNLKVKLGN